MPTRRFGSLAVIGVATLTLSACADTGAVGPTDVETGPAAAAPDSEPAGGGSQAEQTTGGPEVEAAYRCNGPAYPESSWTGGGPASEIDHPGLDALVDDELLAGDEPADLDEWRVLQSDAERLTIARDIDDPAVSSHDIGHTHEVMSAERFPDVGWSMSQAGTCIPRLELEDLGTADVHLDGEVDPSAAHLHLLVIERACASGRDAHGLIRVVALDETDEEIRLVIGVEPREGDHTCPSNPATPVRVDLDAEVGDRDLVDASVLVTRPIEPPPEGLYRGNG